MPEAPSRSIRLRPDQTPPADVQWTDDVPAWPDDDGAPTADERFLLVHGDTIVARAATWRRTVPERAGRPVTVVGHVAASDAAALAALLRDVMAVERGHGDRWLLGPVDGTTWHRYRVVTDFGTEPAFPMEPWNPPWWAEAFEAAGFVVVERYWSAIRALEDDGRPAPSPPPGVRIRPIDPEALDRELAALHGPCQRAFAGSPLFAPLERDAFLTRYRPVIERLDPALCLVAEDGAGGAEDPAGLLLGFIDPHGRLIMKSVAVAERIRGRGLGQSLLETAIGIGHRRGCRAAIYALMHASAGSSRLAEGVATPCRRYALFGVRPAAVDGNGADPEAA